MPSSIIDSPSAGIVVALLTYSYNGLNVRYAAHTSDVQVVGGLTFFAAPSLEITLDKQSGGTQEQTGKIKHKALAPITGMVGEPHAPVLVTISEVNLADTLVVRRVFRGSIKRIKQNAGKKKGVYSVEVAGTLVQADVSLGIVADEICSWIWGGSGCGIDPTQFAQVGTMRPIVGERANVVEITGVTNTLDLHADGFDTTYPTYFNKGRVIKDSLEMDIREYHDDLSPGADVRFVLERQPPAAWLDAAGVAVSVIPGCSRALSICSGTWRNEEYMIPLGKVMPAYNPQLQTP